jgi:hypothetical protein
MVEITLARLLSLDDRTEGEIAWGSLKNWSARSIQRPSVVAMWLDDQGRGVMLLPGLVSRDHGVRTPRSVLKRGGIAEFVLFRPGGPPVQPRRQAPQRVAFWETAS